MKQSLLVLLCIFACCVRADAKGHPYTTVEGEVKSVTIGERKIVIVMSARMRYPMFDNNGNTIKISTAIYREFPITYNRRPGDAELEIQWARHVPLLRDAAGKTMKFVIPGPVYTYAHERITALSTGVLWIMRDDGKAY